jgi:hypothetical protein
MPSPLRPLARLFAPKPRMVERETLQVELPDGRSIALQRVRDACGWRWTSAAHA